jgi:predicted PurR-regulated permease PerM
MSAMARPWFVTSLFLAVFLGAIVLFLRLMGEFVTAIVLALVMLSLFHPVYEWLLLRVKQKRAVAATLTTGVVVLGVVAPVALFALSLSQEAYAFYQSSLDSRFIREVMDFLLGKSPVAIRIRQTTAAFGFELTQDRLTDFYAGIGKEVGLYLYNQISSWAQNALAVFFHFFVMVAVLFTLFVEGDRLKAWIFELSPLPTEEEERLFHQFEAMSQAVFFGNGLASGLQGVMGGLGIAVFGIGPGVLWGALIGILAFLPIVGASVVFLPVTAWLIFSGKFGLAVGYFFYNLSYVFVLEYVVKPRLISGRMQTNAVLIFLGIVAGLSLFGLVGLFYGPLIVTMFLALAEIYREHYRPRLVRGEALWGVPTDELKMKGEAAREPASNQDGGDEMESE